MNISLIANSGIQYHKFKLKIDINDEVINTMGFYEYLDPETAEITLQYAYLLPEDDTWVSKEQLEFNEFFVKGTSKLKEDINTNLLTPLKDIDDENPDYFTI